jgi:hypothetical protein
MAQLNHLVLTAAEYKVLLIIPKAGSFPILTADSIGWNNAREEETVYAIGEEEPIASKRNAAKYSGKLSMQNGEMFSILSIAGLRDATQIAGATLALTAIRGGFARVYSGLNINVEAVDVKAKDKQSMVSLDWTALSIK